MSGLAEFAFGAYEGSVTPMHCLTALDKLGHHLGMFKPEQAVAAQVSFTFIGGPPLQVDDGLVSPVSAIPGTVKRTLR